MSSERLRQRDVHKYYQSWLESSVGFHEGPTTGTTRFHTDGTKFSVSKDTALTSFAQLGCLKLNVKRAVVSLISSNRQYILAEATSTSLLSDGADDSTTDDIWFGNASIPRSQGISGSALTPPDYTATAPDATSFTAPALVISDLATHRDFSSRPYAGDGVSFYCGVPIVTRDGSAIGVYGLTDDKPRHGLKPVELRYLCDLASVIMRHFETVKNEAARFRGESMILGLGQFIQGASTVSSHESFRPRMPSPTSRINTEFQVTTHLFKGMTITAADPSALHTVSGSQEKTHYEAAGSTSDIIKTRNTAQAEENASTSSTSPPAHAPVSDTEKRKPRNPRSIGNTIYTRAANILRECCGADGVLFFDAVSTNLAKRSSPTGFQSANKTSKDKGHERWMSSAQRAISKSSRHSAMTDSEDVESSESAGSNEETVNACTLLGFSVDITEQTQQRAQELKRLAMTESILRRLIRRYPQGKIFYFNPSGEMSSSENDVTVSSAGSETNAVVFQDGSAPGSATTRSKNFKSQFAEELKRLVPQAQSVIWLPMWDFSKQRWSAGAFLWTKLAEQLIVAQDDLIYLKTFANSIMIEVARQDAATADDTKTTFIANISHELRSPLHGVIGSCELLKDTRLDEHQAALVKAIELCGKTLNDTIDHVLDYTKINKLMKTGGQLLKPGAAKPARHTVPAVDKSMLEDDFDLAVLIQDAVETVRASQSSHHQHLRGQLSGDLREEEMVPPKPNEKDVQVILKLAYQDNWWVRSQPGAIKRILLNLVQNALKYTDSGTVTIALSLRTDGLRRQRRRSENKESTGEQDITITVTDTGRGMSNDFVRNHAFTPFSQESSFSDGTGLGLSIVQLIVDSLGGKIELKSRPGVGTEIKVHLTLPQCTPSESLRINEMRAMTAKVAGKSLCLVRPTVESSTSTSRTVETAISNTATAWFGIHIKRSTSFTDEQADFYMCSATPTISEIVNQIDAGVHFENGAIILLASNVFEKLKLKEAFEDLEKRGIVIEIALHPLGPQKLCEVLNRCLSRQIQKTTVEATDLPIPAAQDAMLEPRGVEGKPSEQHVDMDECSKTQSGSTAQRPGITNLMTSESANRRQRVSITMPKTYHSPNTLKDAEPSSPATTNSILDAKASVVPTSTTRRVLLVDDNAINLNILKAAMRIGKFAFETASDGLEALQAFKDSHRETSVPFTHILMDINMPVMDGIESTRLIREFEREQARKDDRSRMPTRGSLWSDRGKSAGELRRPSFQSLSASDDNDNNADEEEEEADADANADADADATSSHNEDLQPASPANKPEKGTSSSRSQRMRPILSTNQTGREPARAMTSVNETQSSSSNPSFPSRDHQGPHPRATVIALSGVAFEQTQKEMFMAGADMFFAKPMKPRELIRLLNEVPIGSG